MSNRIMLARGDQLLETVCSGGNDSAANELLNQFFAGYPIERLRRLLQSKEETAVRAGAWIASELGENAVSLVSELSELLHHPSRYVRFFVLDALLASTTKEHGVAIAKAVSLIRDPDEAVRWKVLRFLAKASSEQLVAAVPNIDDSRVAALTAWLLRFKNTREARHAVLAELEAEDSVRRMFAAAAAARCAERDPVLLERAAASADPEVRSFGREELEALQSRRSR